MGWHGGRNVILDRTIIAGSPEGHPVGTEGFVNLSVTCCDVWGNAAGDYVGALASFAGVNGNISADPLFCNPDSLTLSIDSASPCAPFSPAHPQCDLTGAWPIGCPVAALPTDEAPATNLWLKIVPNPLTRSCQIFCGSPASSRNQEVSLAIYDVSGRLVRRLLDGTPPSNTITLMWNGQDAAGRPLPGGAYYLTGMFGREHSTRAFRIVR